MSKKIVVTIIVLLALVFSAAALFAQEPVSDKDLVPKGSEVVTQPELSPSEEQAVIDFWTPDRIEQAQPAPILVDFSTSLEQLEAMEPVAEPLGAFGFSPSGAPMANADQVARADYPAAWAALEADIPAEEDIRASQYALFKGEPADFSGSSQVYDGWFNTWTIVNKMYPHRWEGRFSFRTPSGTSYCSATSISKNHILTAAHCVYDTGANRWYSNMAFVPAYKAGSAPYGVFPASGCTILTAWVNLSGSFSINSWSRYDLAVCNAGKNSAGKTLNQMVGWMGREWNYGNVRHMHVIGHPWRNYLGNLINNPGKYQYVCTSESFYRSTDVRGTGCAMANGMSGGPWMTGYQLTRVKGRATGVTSGVIYGQRNLYGPRFTSGNIVPICNATGC